MGFPAVWSTLIAKKAAPYISCSVAERWAGQTVVVELQSLLHNVLNFVGERYVEAVARHHFRVAMYCSCVFELQVTHHSAISTRAPPKNLMSNASNWNTARSLAERRWDLLHEPLA